MAKIALFPTFMLLCYVGLFLYFRSRGGYRAVELDTSGHKAGEPAVKREALADSAGAQA